MTKEELQTVGVAALIIGIIGVVIIALVRGLDQAGQRQREDMIAKASRELAVIEEDIRSTGWGSFCTLMLVAVVLLSMAGYSAATTIFQQIEAGVSLIAGLILFGLGAALGRRRTYRIYRSENREPL